MQNNLKHPKFSFKNIQTLYKINKKHHGTLV